MGLIVLLLDGVPETVTLGPDAMGALSALGVTSAALVRDAATVGLVLEGWAFDEAEAERAAAVVAAGATSLRTLRPLAQVAVAPIARTKGADA